jgi:hypothetical protein
VQLSFVDNKNRGKSGTALMTLTLSCAGAFWKEIKSVGKICYCTYSLYLTLYIYVLSCVWKITRKAKCGTALMFL